LQFTINHSAIKRKGYYLVQLAFTLLSISWIFIQLNGKNWEGFEQLAIDDSYLLALIVLLMPANWILESLKWKYLLKNDQQISTREALKHVMNGLLMTWIIPFTVGDVIGRMQYVTDRIVGVKAIFWNRMISFLVAGIFGIVGLATYFQGFSLGWFILSVILHLVVGVVLLATKKIGMIKVYLFTLFRYLLMVFQLYICFRLFGDIENLVWVMAGITWVFFYRSTVPSLWGALGVREASAIVFFSCCMPIEQVLIATLMLWVINLVIPSMLYAVSRTYNLLNQKTTVY
jgi:hypothetical protein